MLVEGSNKRTYAVDRHAGVVRFLSRATDSLRVVGVSFIETRYKAICTGTVRLTHPCGLVIVLNLEAQLGGVVIAFSCALRQHLSLQPRGVPMHSKCSP